MKKLLLIDGHSILNRAFYGLPDLTNSKGLHTNAVYGFLNIMFKLCDQEKPDYITVAFDVHAPTFRHEMFAEYKGTRSPMAEELRMQVPMIKQMLEAMGIVTVEKAGLEADDILGTISTRAAADGMEVVVVSGDRDLLQLAGEHIRISIPKTKQSGTIVEDYYAKDVLEQKQVTPKEFIDVKALMGDSSDNIPGVPGIGEKTATAIIVKYHSIEEAYAHVDELKPPRASKNLREFYDQAVMSKELATIVVDADIDYDMESAAYTDPFTTEAYKLCKEWEFNNLLGRFEGDTPDLGQDHDFKRLTDAAEALEFIDDIKGADTVGISYHRNGDSICGVAFSDGEKAALISFDDVSEDELSEALSGIFAESVIAVSDVKKFLHDLDACEHKGWSEQIFSRRKSGEVLDVSVAAYLLDPNAKTYGYDDVARRYMDDSMAPTYVDLFGKVKPNKIWDEKPQEVVEYLCYDAYVSAASREILKKKLSETGMEKLYFDIELPLVFTLYATECEGIGIDKEALKEYGERLSVGIDALEKSIYEEAGEEFNINSPKQLGVILFEKMELPGAKKTKTGYSTAADVLDKLAPEHKIVRDILEYRTLSKLKSTYADGLYECIDEDGRIRTTFEQTVAATGRLSSTNPNLQNIPIRIELGKEIRKVFKPKEGYVYVDADYSQIELRVLAHMSGDENLIAAYASNQDIHRTTASLVFGVPFDEVTELQRRGAKAVNFGIVYGISAFGLGEDLGISRQQAQEYIDGYYVAYPKLKGFLDGCISDAKEAGYSLTMFGRRRPIADINSSNFMKRSFSERVAMNAPIQGSAADIIKIAMNRVYDRLCEEGLESRLILQVHDELLIEAKEEEADRVTELLAEEMAGAADLAVTLEVDVHRGNTWYDAK